MEISSFGAALPGRRRAAGGEPGASSRRSRCEDVPADWRERRRRFGGGAVLISDRLVVRSPHDPPAPEGLLEVVIERGGSGFGSGSHPTTQMCLGLLLELEPARRRRRLRLRRRHAGDRGGQARLGAGVRPRPRGAGDRGGASSTRGATASSADFAHADVATAELPIRELLMANAPPPVHERLAAAVTPQVRHVIVSGIVEGELEHGPRGLRRRRPAPAAGDGGRLVDRDAAGARGWLIRSIPARPSLAGRGVRPARDPARRRRAADLLLAAGGVQLPRGDPDRAGAVPLRPHAAAGDARRHAAPARRPRAPLGGRGGLVGRLPRAGEPRRAAASCAG